MLKFPPKLIVILDKIRRRCLSTKKTEQGDKCNSLAAWDMVCRPKKKGGLGVINLKIHNDALFLKFLHKFYNRMDVPWVSLLWDIYYTDKITHTAEPLGSFWWCDILKLMPVYRGVSRVQIVNGSTALFWKDLWNDNFLQITHPRAFSFATKEDVSVEDFLGSTTLDENFYLPLSPQALDEVHELQEISMHL